MSETASELVLRLAAEHHARGAFRALLALGAAALPGVRAGLTHDSRAVRYWCCRFLDHFVAAEMVDDLFEMLADPAPEVRAAAMHALACDRCKAGDCRPDAKRTLTLAMERLRCDPDAHVRAHAVGAIGEMANESGEALQAILAAAGSDPSPAVRKKARWYAPGGPIFERQRSKSGRLRRRAA
ncbi:MAG TPA: HEAT repeat domain-containing protein [Caulobacteraceae bacterium]|nr:HEAT repeat domain-containing protein [Caulobacteraceae bacterium]